MLLLWTLTLRKVQSLRFQKPSALDVLRARSILFENAMNPLSISDKTLLACYERNKMVGFGQIRPLDENFSELASLYVLPEKRSRGIGSSIVQKLLDEHDASSIATPICLLTLKPTAVFYKQFGFDILEENQIRAEMPSNFQFEYTAGCAISAVLGNELICMVRRVESESVDSNATT